MLDAVDNAAMEDAMKSHQVVSPDKWTAARTDLLTREKAASKAREALTAAKAAMPWMEVETEYAFDGPNGTVTLADLFEGRSQLIISHFMFAPEWDAGCPSCSFWADGYNGQVAHLNQRDVSLAAISRAPIEKLEAYRKRMGWSFKWVSSGSNTFNQDFGVAFAPDMLESGAKNYNFGTSRFGGSDAPGFSVFARDGARIFRTYSCYSRGLEVLNPTYHFLDMVPKGRNEAGLDYAQAWVRRRDEY